MPNETIRINLNINEKQVQAITMFPYRLNSAGKINCPEVLEQAIRNKEHYSTLIYLMGGSSQLYRMMRNNFGGTLTTLRRRWNVQVKA